MSPDIIKQIQQASVGNAETSLLSLKLQFIEHTRKYCAASTVGARRSRMKHFVHFMTTAGIMDITDVNNAVLSIYFEHLSGKESSMNASRKVLKGFFNWVEQYKEIQTSINVNNIRPIKEPKRNPTYLVFSEINKVIDGNVAYIDRLLTAIGAMIGLRASEIANIRMGDIKGDQIRVIGKGNIERIVTIPHKVQIMVETYKQIAPYPLTDEDFLFQSYWRDEWRPITAKTVWRRIKHVFHMTCNIDTTPHALRHSYAVNLLIMGCDLVTIQKSLGHTDIKVTQIYLNISNELVSGQIHKYLG